MQENAKLLNDTINQRSEAEGLLDSGIKSQQVRTLSLSLKFIKKIKFTVYTCTLNMIFFYKIC